MSQPDPARQLLRHTVATIAYRGCESHTRRVRYVRGFSSRARCKDARSDSGSYRRSSGLGLINRQRPAALARFEAASVGPGSTPLLRRAGGAGRLSGVGQPARSPAREAVSSAHRRCAHAYRADRDTAQAGGSAGARGELLRRENRGGSGERGSARARAGVHLDGSGIDCSRLASASTARITRSVLPPYILRISSAE